MLKESLSVVTMAAALLIGFGYGCSSSSDPAATNAEGGGGDDDATPPKDAKPESAKPDAITPPDTDGGLCEPGDVGGFAPTWKPPAAIHSSKCTNAQAEQAALCTFDKTQDAATCKAFTGAAENADCMKCVFTANTGATLGPVIVDTAKGLVQLNLDGCVSALSGQTGADSCGAKAQAANDCAGAACLENCPVAKDGEGIDELNKCLQAAPTSVCKSFADAQGTCVDDATKAGGPAEACAAGASQADLAVNIAQIFCGPPQGDAGPGDAPHDG